MTKGSGKHSITWGVFALIFLLLAIFKTLEFGFWHGRDGMLWLIALGCAGLSVFTRHLHRQDN